MIEAQKLRGVEVDVPPLAGFTAIEDPKPESRVTFKEVIIYSVTTLGTER